MGLLSENQGWLIDDDRLLITQDGGIHWDDHTPSGISHIWDVHFSDISGGLLLYQNKLGLGLLATSDGAASWSAMPLPISAERFAAANLNFSNETTGLLELSLSSGSSFNLVQQYSTIDGGKTWSDPETLPRPVAEELLQSIRHQANLPESTIQVAWLDANIGWALTQRGTCQGEKLPLWQAAPPDAQPWHCSLQTQLWATANGGQTWVEITP
jgi:photosystem II stability/assembly factor-like uncharacterized protein